MEVKGVLDISDTKEANNRRIGDSVAQDANMKKIALKCAEMLDQMRGSSNNN